MVCYGKEQNGTEWNGMKQNRIPERSSRKISRAKAKGGKEGKETYGQVDTTIQDFIPRRRPHHKQGSKVHR